MENKYTMCRSLLIVLSFVSFVFISSMIDDFVTELNLPAIPLDYSINLPAYFLNNAPGPLPTSINGLDNTPANNPITNAGATLGRVLFYDVNLSQNRTISCASCHQAGNGFSDPSPLSSGFNGGQTRRHSMTLIFSRYYQRGRFFWDERAATLEQQVLMPFQDSVEMGLTLTTLVDRVNEQYYYSALFSDAFGSSTVNTDLISKALAQFVRSIVSYNSKYDIGRSQVNNPGAPFPNFTAQENQGKQLFFASIPNGGGACFGCHTTEAFVSANPGPQNNGIDSISTTDFGAGETFPTIPLFQGRFKTSTLRNIELTAPYMHDGRFQTLEQVVDHYNTNIQPHPTLSAALKDANNNPINLNFSAAQKAALVAFMRTWTDVSVATAAKWSNPFMNNTNLVVTNQNDSGIGSMRSIMNCAGTGDTIRFAANIDTIFLNIPLRIFKHIALKDDIGNPVVIKANFNNSGFLNATYGINIAPNVNVYLHNIKLSHYNNSNTKPLLKNEGNLTLSTCELNGNLKSIVNNQAGNLTIKNIVSIK
ncbi:MAG: cytochrome-c peroxidase [Saprospiraceae bacterium]|nr:cytochrome-c peroxidase [Saprospiraceae bacterium]